MRAQQICSNGARCDCPSDKLLVGKDEPIVLGNFNIKMIWFLVLKACRKFGAELTKTPPPSSMNAIDVEA